MRPKYLLDANLIVLLAVGNTGLRLISGHKRLTEFRPENFEILEDLLSTASEITSLPNAWAEASNLLGPNNNDHQSAAIFMTFRNLVQKFGCKYIPSSTAATRAEFRFLGLTDCALLELAKLDFTILSVDVKLCIAAQSAGLKAQNFNHLRGL